MSGPSQIQIKRKRDEPGPEKLVVERAQKRNRAHYILQNAGDQQGHDMHRLEQLQDDRPRSTVTKTVGDLRREFHLTKPVRTPASRKQGGSRSVATFVEAQGSETSTVTHSDHDSATVLDPDEANARPLKAPGRGVAVKNIRKSHPAVPPQSTERLESMADDLHQFALDELSREAKPKVTATPKLAGARSKELHRQRASPRDARDIDQDVIMGNDSEYVYDVYVLASDSGADEARMEVSGEDDENVGYLVITEEDQSIWEAFLDSEGSDKEWDTDEEDENAEDYYGADYPEDELASDDEHGRNTYGFRAHGGSDDEEWDEDTGVYSDEDEHDRMMNPWKRRTPVSFAKDMLE